VRFVRAFKSKLSTNSIAQKKIRKRNNNNKLMRVCVCECELWSYKYVLENAPKFKAKQPHCSISNNNNKRQQQTQQK